MVGYLSRDASGPKDIETNPFQPRLLILDQAFNEVDNIQISNETGFAHVHPTLVIQDGTLHYAWSKRTSGGPQVQVERYELSFVDNDPLSGDANGDGEVAFADFLILSSNFGRADADIVFADGDFNGDGEVGFADFLILSSNFGRQIAAAATDELFRL